MPGAYVTWNPPRPEALVASSEKDAKPSQSDCAVQAIHMYTQTKIKKELHPNTGNATQRLFSMHANSLFLRPPRRIRNERNN